jgi:hypothetical protein
MNKYLVYMPSLFGCLVYTLLCWLDSGAFSVAFFKTAFWGYLPFIYSAIVSINKRWRKVSQVGSVLILVIYCYGYYLVSMVSTGYLSSGLLYFMPIIAIVAFHLLWLIAMLTALGKVHLDHSR